MYQAPEQLTALNKANLEIAKRFAGVAMEGAERMLDLQLKAAKSAFADSVETAKVLASVKDIQQFAALKDELAQPAIEKATAYAKSVYDVAAATQAEYSKLFEEQVSVFNKQMVTALDKMAQNRSGRIRSRRRRHQIRDLPQSTASYDNLSKAGKQFAEAGKSNFEAVAKQTTSGKKKAKK